MMGDPLLKRYSVIMLDEAHERTVYMDVVVGLLYKIQKKRPDLRLIISSATMDAESFKNFFNHNSTRDKSKDTSAIMSITGRTYPVDIFYSEKPVRDPAARLPPVRPARPQPVVPSRSLLGFLKVPNYIEATVKTVFDIHQAEKAGDILAFLTGQDEVDAVCEKLRERAEEIEGHGGLDGLLVLPMYGGLPAMEQMKVFDRPPDGFRKVIIATNIAEASITIEGVVYVVDAGFAKIKGYNPKTGIESLVIAPVSKASAKQRAGRAGRVRSGKCYRLYTEADHAKLAPMNLPEMQRSNLAGVLLQLKALGIDNVLRFPFLSPPPAEAMMRGLELLLSLGALDEYGKRLPRRRAIRYGQAY